MDEQQAIKTILKICEHEEGFPVQLRVHAVFDEKQYHELIEAIKAYKEFLGSADKINRRVASNLFMLETVVVNQVHYYEKTQHRDKRRLRDAHNELWELTNELLWHKE